MLLLLGLLLLDGLGGLLLLLLPLLLGRLGGLLSPEDLALEQRPEGVRHPVIGLRDPAARQGVELVGLLGKGPDGLTQIGGRLVLGALGAVQRLLGAGAGGVGLGLGLHFGGGLGHALPGGPDGLIGHAQIQHRRLDLPLQGGGIHLILPGGGRLGVLHRRRHQGGGVQFHRVKGDQHLLQVIVLRVQLAQLLDGQPRLLLAGLVLGQLPVQLVQLGLGAVHRLLGAGPPLQLGLGGGQVLLQHGLAALQGGGHLPVHVVVGQRVHQLLTVVHGEHQPHQPLHVPQSGGGGAAASAGGAAPRRLQGGQQGVQPLLGLGHRLVHHGSVGQGHVPAPADLLGRAVLLLAEQDHGAVLIAVLALEPVAPHRAVRLVGRPLGPGHLGGLLLVLGRPQVGLAQAFPGDQLPVGGVLLRGEPEAVHLGLALPLLIAAQGGEAQLLVDDQEAVPPVGLGELGLPKGLPQLPGGEAQQPRPVQGSPAELAGVDHLSALGVEGAVAVHGQLGQAALVPQLAVLVPLDGAVRLSGGKFAPDLIAVLQVEGAAAVVESLGEGAPVEHIPVLPVRGALPLVEALGKGTGVGPLAAGVVGGAVPLLEAGRKVPPVGQGAVLIQAPHALVQAVGKLPLIDQHAALIAGAGAAAHPVHKIALVDEQAVLVILPALALEQAVLQGPAVHGVLLGLVVVDHHPARPAVQIPVLLPEVGGKEMTEEEGPHHKVDQQGGHHQPHRQQDQKGLGHKQTLSLDVVLPLGGLLHRRGRPLEGGGGHLGGIPGDVGDPAPIGPYPGHLPGEEGPDGAEKDSKRSGDLSQQKAKQRKSPYVSSSGPMPCMKTWHISNVQSKV